MTLPLPAFLSRTSIRALIAALLLAGTVTLAQAEAADRNKPMNIEADAMRYDDLKQTSVFTGNVVVTKGTIIIRGDRIDVRQDPEGYQYGVVTMATPGKLAYFKQKRSTGVDEWIEGQGEEIDYDSRADNVKFIRQAVMRRLIGAKVNDESSGPLIVYDQSNDTFTVNGSTLPPNAGVDAKAGGRVRAVLTPKPVALPGGASPNAPKPAPGTPLRPSTTLSPEAGK
jgi:lipopolysaccharide export system protein LptA